MNTRVCIWLCIFNYNALKACHFGFSFELSLHFCYVLWLCRSFVQLRAAFGGKGENVLLGLLSLFLLCRRYLNQAVRQWRITPLPASLVLPAS